MRLGHLRGIVASFVVCLVALLIVSAIPVSLAGTASAPGTRQADLILKVGGQDEMKTRNLLPSAANDVWTSDVHYRAYHSVLLGNPDLDKPMAYIAKGVDYNENGIFEPATEYDVWAEQAGATSNLSITVYYDFNGVFWHDGKQMTVWDLFFSYHVSAMNARFNTDLRVLMMERDAQGNPIYGNSRQLGIALGTKNWQGESTLPGDPNLRVAITYTLNAPFALFYDSTLFPVMLPSHEWSRTYGGKHADFGCAVWIPTAEATAKGIPECGNTDSSKWSHGIGATEPVPGSRSYNYPAAEGWSLTDADIIGNGPFRFTSWIPGVEAKVTRYDQYFTGVDPANPSTVYDATLSARLQKPIIEGIRFLVYRTTQLGVFALQSGEIDFYHWNVGAEFVPDLLKIPEIAVESNAEPGFFYMSYNFRREPWGYRGGDPAQPDDGYWLRQAFSHVIDKKSIVQNLLQNFGVVGHGVISPSNTFWYNDNIPKPAYDLAQAAALLDAHGYGPDPAGACDRSGAGCRSLGSRLGTNSFDILTPQADYDPVRASAGAMVADAMRQVGVNAVSRPTAFGEIVNKISIHDFDVFILGWRISGTDPDYLFSFFDSSNAAAGQNYPGFQNTTFDTAIRASRAELDRATRQQYIFTCQQLLADARPYDVLYFRTNIEGYRQDRFVGWSVSSGTIWNFWSIQRVHPPSANAIHIVVTAPSAVQANSTETITVSVFDNTNLALPGASVNVSLGPGLLQGNLTAIGSTTPVKYVAGLSDPNGRFQVRYLAAGVAARNTTIITAEAMKPPTYPDTVTRQAVLQVFPIGQPFLSLNVALPSGDRMPLGTTLPMQITVRDQDRNTVTDAQVNLAVSPPGYLTPNPQSGTSAQMGSVILTASQDLAAAGSYTLTAQATKATFATASATAQVTITTGNELTKLCPDGKRYPLSQPCPTVSTPGLEVLPILAGIGIAALVAGVVAERKRRS